MGLQDLTSREAVLRAIEEYDAVGQASFLEKYGFGRARDYVLVLGDREYDSKAIVGAAHGYQHPDRGPLPYQDFNGGRPTIEKLQSLGFEVRQLPSEVSATAHGPVWKVRGGRQGQSEEEGLAEGFVAIGWGELPDLSLIQSKDEVAALLTEHTEDTVRQIAARKVFVYDFVREIKVGDVILLPLKTKPGFVAVARTTSDYEYRPQALKHSRHVRRVDWLNRAVAIQQFGHLRRWIDLPGTVGRVSPTAAEETILHMLATGEAIGAADDDATTLAAVIEAILLEQQRGAPDVDRLRVLVTEEGPAAAQAAVGPTWQVKGRIGIGTVAEVPWIGIYSSDASASAKSGFYVVFLFAADGSAVYLSLNQGTENVRGGVNPIRKRALDLRAASRITGDDGRVIDLASTAARPRKYEAGNAFALTHSAGEVPVGDQMRRDLEKVLGYLLAAQSSGLHFHPELEPLHAVFKWSADIEAQTVALHKAKADERGSTWWGRFGEGNSPISAARLEQLREQLGNGVPTSVFLFGGSEVVRTRLEEITLDRQDVDADRLPGYYPKEKCNLFVRLSGFEPLEQGWLQQRAVLASNPDLGKTAGALNNQTNPLYVYELFNPGNVMPPPAPELTMEWLMAKTLWLEKDLEELLEAIEERGQVILAGPPGTGKTWVAEHIARYVTAQQPSALRIIQFHPSYGYEEFIEGLRPVIDQDVLTFKLVPGVILQMAEEMEDSSTLRVLIIDELNRANIPRVFGELMYALEYRDTPIDLQYSRDFELPTNLKFVATMNTADRSIRSIDVALRRRFEIFECPSDPDILKRYYENDERTTTVPCLVQGFTALNAALTERIDRHHTIGQSYFMASQFSKQQLLRTWKRQIKPLIEDYFFDQQDLVDAFKPETYWPDL